MWAYFDTSALVKRYVEEAGRLNVLQLLRGHRVVVSAILPVELRSAFRRRVTDRTLDAEQLSRIASRVAADRDYWTLVEVSTEVLAAAETLANAYSLRTLDAIHVASAQLFAARTSTPALTFVSADRRQTETAAAVGLAVRHIA